MAKTDGVVVQFGRRKAEARRIECSVQLEFEPGKVRCRVYGCDGSKYSMEAIASALEGAATELRGRGANPS